MVDLLVTWVIFLVTQRKNFSRLTLTLNAKKFSTFNTNFWFLVVVENIVVFLAQGLNLRKKFTKF